MSLGLVLIDSSWGVPLEAAAAAICGGHFIILSLVNNTLEVKWLLFLFVGKINKPPYIEKLLHTVYQLI
jgi:hypothetical protein